MHEVMGSREGQDQVRQALDYAEVGRLALQIAETAQRASEVAEKMAKAESDEIRNELGAKLKILVDEGSALAARQARANGRSML